MFSAFKSAKRPLSTQWPPLKGLVLPSGLASRDMHHVIVGMHLQPMHFARPRTLSNSQAGVPLDSMATPSLAPNRVTRAQGSLQTWRYWDKSV